MGNPIDPRLLEWSQAILGPLQLLSDASREHPGQRTGALRLTGASGDYFLKIHKEETGWQSEVNGYRAWAAAFAGAAPELLAVHDAEPLALLLRALPGRILDEAELPASQALAVWRRAGEALAGLHAWAEGSFFGPCRTDGSPAAEAFFEDAPAFVEGEMIKWLERGRRAGVLRREETALVERARALVRRDRLRVLPLGRTGRGLYPLPQLGVAPAPRVDRGL